MTETPKCRSWMGHKFEARYSLGAVTAPPKYNVQHASEHHIETVIGMFRTQTYEGDICVRCGFVVERKTPEKATN